MNSKFKRSNVLFIIILLLLRICEGNSLIVKNFFNEINILINQTINKAILNSTYSQYVEQIIIDGNIQNYIDYKIQNLDNKINNITIKWKTQLTSCYAMFKNLNNIINVDLSKFDSSNVLTMYHMFFGCGSLISINLNNFETRKATNMNGMFDLCSSLISLDLSNFITSSVKDISGMFYGCSSLIVLDLSSFDTSEVTKMTHVFNGCKSLISVNLNSFDTSKTYTLYHFFEGCSSLISLNLYNFTTSSITDTLEIEDMFYLLNSNLKYCIKDNYNYLFKSLLNGFIKNCNDICFTDPNHKLIKEKYICIDECKNDNTYRYEFNKICYINCPEGTHISSKNNYVCELELICENYYNYEHTECLNEIPEGYFLNDTDRRTIDKCDIKCKNCCLESNNDGLCISCNIDELYYPKISDNSEQNTFVECCNQKPDGYFFDSNNRVYRQCFPTCKECNEYGNTNDNKCLECYSNFSFFDGNCYQTCKYYHYFNESNNYQCTLNESCPKEFNKLIESKKRCVDNCSNDDKYKYEYNNICYEYEMNILTTNVNIDENNDNNILTTNFNIDENNDNNILTTNFNIDENNDNNILTTNFDIDENNDNNILTTNFNIDENNDYNINTDNNIDNNIYDTETNYFESTDSINFTQKEKSNNFDNKFNVISLFNKYVINYNSSKEKDYIIDSIKEELRLNNEIKDIITNVIEIDGNDLVIYFDDAIYQLTSTFNQNNNIYSNFSIIILNECENILKFHYNISLNDSLLIFKIDKFGKDYLISIVEYEVYNIKTKEKLNLSLCENINISILYPVNIDKNNYFKYDSSSKYYNDICNVYTTENNTDICTKDRQREYDEEKLPLCEVNCNLNGYDSHNKRVECKCLIKIKFLSFSEIIIDKDKFLRNFIDIKNIINLYIMKCYNVLFTKKGIIKNIGSYAILSIIFSFLISIFIFFTKGYKLLFKNIDKFKYQKKKISTKKKKINNLKIKNKNNPPKILKRNKKKCSKTTLIKTKNKFINNSSILRIKKHNTNINNFMVTDSKHNKKHPEKII